MSIFPFFPKLLLLNKIAKSVKSTYVKPNYKQTKKINQMQ